MMPAIHDLRFIVTYDFFGAADALKSRAPWRLDV
jgi:hypothetical protein